METEQDQVPQNAEKLKEIPKWTRKYAQNRTLTILVLMVMICLVSGVTAFSLAFTMTAFMRGKLILAGIGTAVSVAIFISLIVFVAKFGGKNRGLIDQKIDKRIYGKEGTASVPVPKSSKKRICLEIVSGVIFFICFFGSWYLAMEGYIAFKYLQPVSALYIVPYAACGWYFWQSPRMGPIYLLYPILYAIHAIVIVAGVPLFFTGTWSILSVCLPSIGYSFVPLVIGHLYSRYALKKLKGISHLEGNTINGD